MTMTKKLSQTCLSSEDAGERTRILARWKLEVIPATSAKDCLHFFVQSYNDNDVSSDEAAVVSTLLAIINDELSFTTEGHRETSLEILHGLLQRAFCQRSIQENNSSSQEKVIVVLQSLFQKCSHLFERRMSRLGNSDHRDFHGILMQPIEQSEHIRLKLVEIMSDLGSYLMLHQEKVKRNPSSSNQYKTASRGGHTTENATVEVKAASRTYQTLAKHVFADKFPDILMASCTLVKTLTKLSPEATVQHATDLLLQLAGKDVKHCLFRNRRSRIRSEAVETSCAIVLCCENFEQDDLSISSMQKVLQSIVLPGWEDLLKMDPSALVRVAVLNAVGMVAGKFSWTCSLTKEHFDRGCSGNDVVHQSLELAKFVESNLLFLFLLGASDGNVQVTESALNCGINDVKGSRVPWNVFSQYFHPVLELLLASCSLSLSTCKCRVRSLEALQVFLSFAIATPCLTLQRIQPIIECLHNNIMSEEKEILEAALKACSILGGSDTFSKLVLDMLVVSNEETIELSKVVVSTMISSPRKAASTLLLLSHMVKGMICNDEVAINLHRLDPTLSISSPNWIYASPSSMAIITTVLSYPSITNCVADNPSLAWALLDALSELVKSCRYHLNNKREDDIAWTLKEEAVLEILIGLLHLLGCPAAYGLSYKVKQILQEFSSCFLCEAEDADEKRSLLDVHFRKLVKKLQASHAVTTTIQAIDDRKRIASSYSVISTLPWKETDAAFIAMSSLLKASKGTTVSSNFDLAAPFFLHHMSGSEIEQDREAEEYSLRITVMSVLQIILSDQTFYSPGTNITSTRLATDVILSLIVPNLVWRPGGLSSALRKLSVATLFSLLRHLKVDEASILDTDTLTQLIPMLHLCADDTEGSTRELACLCLSKILEQTSPEVFRTLWQADARVVDELQAHLLSSLDDSHKPVRLAACSALKGLLIFKHSTKSASTCDQALSSSETFFSSLLVHLDDDEREVQEQVYGVLVVFLELQMRETSNRNILAVAQRRLKDEVDTHRVGSYRFSLLRLIQG